MENLKWLWVIVFLLAMTSCNIGDIELDTYTVIGIIVLLAVPSLKILFWLIDQYYEIKEINKKVEEEKRKQASVAIEQALKKAAEENRKQQAAEQARKEAEYEKELRAEITANKNELKEQLRKEKMSEFIKKEMKK